MKELGQFSTSDLHNEIARRERSDRDSGPIAHCDECANFRFAKNATVPDWNPCSRGHVMRFRMPRFVGDMEWGHYRRKCVDRKRATAVSVGDDAPITREPDEQNK